MDMFVWATQVAEAMGSRWSAERWGKSPDDNVTWGADIVSDFLRLSCHLDSHKGRVSIMPDNIEGVDSTGRPYVYRTGRDVPRISVAVNRTPAAIAADIRSRLQSDAEQWYTAGQQVMQEYARRAAVVEGFRQQLVKVGFRIAPHNSGNIAHADNSVVEMDSRDVTLTLRSLPHADCLAVLQFLRMRREKLAAPSSSTQIDMFPSGDDLPLFTLLGDE